MTTFDSLLLQKMMSKEKGSCFKLEYERCHDDKNEHFALAAMIGYILSFRCPLLTKGCVLLFRLKVLPNENWGGSSLALTNRLYKTMKQISTEEEKPFTSSSNIYPGAWFRKELGWVERRLPPSPPPHFPVDRGYLIYRRRNRYSPPLCFLPVQNWLVGKLFWPFISIPSRKN